MNPLQPGQVGQVGQVGQKKRTRDDSPEHKESSLFAVPKNDAQEQSLAEKKQPTGSVKKSDQSQQFKDRFLFSTTVNEDSEVDSKEEMKHIVDALSMPKQSFGEKIESLSESLRFNPQLQKNFAKWMVDNEWSPKIISNLVSLICNQNPVPFNQTEATRLIMQAISKKVLRFADFKNHLEENRVTEARLDTENRGEISSNQQEMTLDTENGDAGSENSLQKELGASDILDKDGRLANRKNLCELIVRQNKPFFNFKDEDTQVNLGVALYGYGGDKDVCLSGIFNFKNDYHISLLTKILPSFTSNSAKCLILQSIADGEIDLDVEKLESFTALLDLISNPDFIGDNEDVIKDFLLLMGEGDSFMTTLDEKIPAYVYNEKFGKLRKLIGKFDYDSKSYLNPEQKNNIKEFLDWEEVVDEFNQQTELLTKI